MTRFLNETKTTKDVNMEIKQSANHIKQFKAFGE